MSYLVTIWYINLSMIPNGHATTYRMTKKEFSWSIATPFKLNCNKLTKKNKPRAFGK